MFTRTRTAQPYTEHKVGEVRGYNSRSVDRLRAAPCANGTVANGLSDRHRLNHEGHRLLHDRSSYVL